MAPIAVGLLQRLHPVRVAPTAAAAIGCRQFAGHAFGGRPGSRAYGGGGVQVRTTVRAETTYAFGGVVYVGLTNDCSCALTMLAANGPGFTFPPGTGFLPLPAGYEPTGAEAAEAALAACRRLDAEEGGGGPRPREVVFAGLGEPLLRLDTLCKALELLSASAAQAHVRGRRLNTNGLIAGGRSGAAGEAARRLSAAGLDSACVQLQSGDEAQHRELVAPHDGQVGLADAKELVVQLLQAGVKVECSVVGRPEVDLAKAEAVATALGASFKVRPYFP